MTNVLYLALYRHTIIVEDFNLYDTFFFKITILEKRMVFKSKITII